MNYSRHGIQAIVSGNGIHVAGGSESGISIKKMEVYGTDNPIGNPNVNSTFPPDETTKAFTYTSGEGSVSIDILLSYTSGTTGTYIKSVEISGDNYTLMEFYDNRLLGVNDNLIVTAVLNDTTQNESDGNVTITYNNNLVVNIVLDGELDGALSIASPNTELSRVKLYPNPVNDTFSFNKNVTRLFLYDISGKLIKEFNGNLESGTQFDISNLPENIYFVKIENALNENHLTKLVKL